MLEIRLRSIKIIAGVSPTAVATATADTNLQKLLYAIGV